ncbi:MAG TPA: hypothetical protein VGR57_13800 [Ktedonobacterales bacterium]|nr:hypothetical protein [Ktedonobacterales bacterium]
MDRTLAPAARLAVPAAYAAAVLFALHLASYFVPTVRDATLAHAAGLAIALAVLALAQHLVVLPVVAALPAPAWARFAAVVWLGVDMGTDLAQLVGEPVSAYLNVRLAVNVLAALWIATASLGDRGALRVIGLVVALDFAAYSALALVFKQAFLVALPSLVLLPIWFALVGRRLDR